MKTMYGQVFLSAGTRVAGVRASAGRGTKDDRVGNTKCGSPLELATQLLQLVIKYVALLRDLDDDLLALKRLLLCKTRKAPSS